MASRISNLAKFLWFGGGTGSWPGSLPNQWQDTSYPQYRMGRDLDDDVYPSGFEGGLAELRLTKPGFIFNPNTDLFAQGAYKSANINNYLLPAGNGYPGVIQAAAGATAYADIAPFKWTPNTPSNVPSDSNMSIVLQGSRGNGFRITASGGSIGPFSGCLLCVDERPFNPTQPNSLVLGWIDFTTPTIPSYTQPEGGQLIISGIYLTIT